MREQINKIGKKARDILINAGKRRKLRNHDFTLISCDCTGGMIYHDLKQQFRTPTINMYFTAPDYVKFIKNIRSYLDEPMIDMEEESRREGYPVAALGDIRLHLVHYASVAEAQMKWNERKKRINWNNCFYILCDRNYCTPEVMRDFDDFITGGGYSGVLFTHEPHEELKSSFYIRGSESKDCIDGMTLNTSLLRKRYDMFDWVGFLNGHR